MEDKGWPETRRNTTLPCGAGSLCNTLHHPEPITNIKLLLTRQPFLWPNSALLSSSHVFLEERLSCLSIPLFLHPPNSFAVLPPMAAHAMAGLVYGRATKGAGWLQPLEKMKLIRSTASLNEPEGSRSDCLRHNRKGLPLATSVTFAPDMANVCRKNDGRSTLSI